jgi:hypothetical protein
MAVLLNIAYIAIIIILIVAVGIVLLVVWVRNQAFKLQFVLSPTQWKTYDALISEGCSTAAVRLLLPPMCKLKIVTDRARMDLPQELREKIEDVELDPKTVPLYEYLLNQTGRPRREWKWRILSTLPSEHVPA